MPSPHPSSSRSAERLIRRTLDALTPKERAALLLRWKGMADREIAATLGITRVTVRMRFYRARRRLADWPELQALLAPPGGRRHG